MAGYWVWGGSVVKAEDGRYHMFASRWPDRLSFLPHWLTNSEIVRVSSDTPEGPYHFEEVVLGPCGSGFWDGCMTHNPTIHRCGAMYLLFYVGTTYIGSRPTDTRQEHDNSPLVLQARANQRIGLATAETIHGPWVRRSEPILSPRPGRWDALMTTNPAVCVLDDESVLLIYKSATCQNGLLQLGIAHADHYAGPYHRLRDNPILSFGQAGDHVEDPYIWRSGGRFDMIMKDMNGGICGEKNGGIRATSNNGIDWHICDPPLAYSRTIHWEDGTSTTQGCLERPQLLIQNGQPTHAFFATADGPGAYTRATRTWNMVIPLRG